MGLQLMIPRTTVSTTHVTLLNRLFNRTILLGSSHRHSPVQCPVVQGRNIGVTARVALKVGQCV